MLRSMLFLLGFQGTVPEQVHIAFGKDPRTTMSVAWQTPMPTEDQVIEWGSGANRQRTSARRVRYQRETGAIYEVRLQNLQPDTTYSYRVGEEAGGWSRTYQFRTAPRSPRQFHFTAFGDHGVTPKALWNARNVMRENPAFHLLLGDISYANGNQPVWDDYLRQIEPMAAQFPIMAALGNHENETIKVDGTPLRIGYEAYLARFALPEPEQQYWFDYGNARFVSFNSDKYADADQLAWLGRTLSDARRNARVKWLIVFQHHPPYGSCEKRGDNLPLIKAVTPIFDQFKVDLVLSGHDHHYERQYPLRDGQITSKSPGQYRQGDGTLYVKQGGGGKSLYNFVDPQPEMCAFREKSYGYLKVTVPDRGPLVIDALRSDNTLMERIEILPRDRS